jgi:hypothetical protein
LPVLIVFSYLLLPGSAGLLFEHGEERTERLFGIADQVQVHGITHPNHAPIDVDLYCARLSELRQELGIGKARADHEQCVAVNHHLPAGACAEQADGPRHVRQIVGNDSFAEQSFGDARAEHLRHGNHLILSVFGAIAD